LLVGVTFYEQIERGPQTCVQALEQLRGNVKYGPLNMMEPAVEDNTNGHAANAATGG
jgi:hypothetical protein